MSYESCVNCAEQVIDPTNPGEEARFIHLHTLQALCHEDDLHGRVSTAELAEQRAGLANYSACPAPTVSEDFCDDDGHDVDDIIEGDRVVGRACVRCGKTAEDIYDDATTLW